MKVNAVREVASSKHVSSKKYMPTEKQTYVPWFIDPFLLHKTHLLKWMTINYYFFKSKAMIFFSQLIFQIIYLFPSSSFLSPSPLENFPHQTNFLSLNKMFRLLNSL